MIVIAGGVVNGWDLFEKHMHQQVEERAFPLLAARVKIERAKLPLPRRTRCPCLLRPQQPNR